MALVEHYGEAPPFNLDLAPTVLAPACRDYLITYGGILSYPHLWVAAMASRLWSLHPQTVFRLARLAGGLWVIAAALFAVRLARRHGGSTAFRSAAWSILLLMSPIGIQQSFAVSLDGGVLAFSVVMAAFFASGSAWLKRDWLWFGIFGVVALQSKPVFAPLLLGFFFVPGFRQAGWLRVLVVGLLCSYGIGSGLLSRATQVNGPEGRSGAQMAQILAHPLESLTLITWTTLKRAVIPTQWMLARLGWLDHSGSNLALGTTLGSLLLIVLSGLRELGVPKPPVFRDWIFAVVWLGSASLVTLFMYLVWTPPGSAYVTGLQGRYFLPYLIVLGGYALTRLEFGTAQKALRGVVWVQSLSVLFSVWDALRFYGIL
jgi:uncharacterized membrane protein